MMSRPLTILTRAKSSSQAEDWTPKVDSPLAKRAESSGVAASDEKKESKQTDVATLRLPDGREFEFPILHGSMGPSVVDVRTFYAKTGLFTFDPGFTSTASW